MPEFLIIVFAVGLVLMALAPEFASWQVYGRLLKDHEMEDYLKKYLPRATLNPFSKSRDLFADMPEYISTGGGYTSKWHIHNYGRVPRWSVWHKEIEAVHKKLLAETPKYVKPTLSEL